MPSDRMWSEIFLRRGSMASPMACSHTGLTVRQLFSLVGVRAVRLVEARTHTVPPCTRVSASKGPGTPRASRPLSPAGRRSPRRTLTKAVHFGVTEQVHAPVAAGRAGWPRGVHRMCVLRPPVVVPRGKTRPRLRPQAEGLTAVATDCSRIRPRRGNLTKQKNK